MATTEQGRSAYSETLEEIRLTLERRSRNHRNLVIAVVGIGLAGLVWSIACSCLRGLSVLGAVFPTISLFLLRDLSLTSGWQASVHDKCRRGELEIPVLRELVSNAPDLPESTVDGMLAGPAVSSPIDGLGRGPSDGGAVPDVIAAANSYWRTRLLGGLIAGLYGATCWMMVVLKGSWAFAVALGGIPILMILARKYAERRLKEPGRT